MSKKLLWVGALGVGAIFVFAQSGSWLDGTADQKFAKLASTQPGLGTVMVEFGNRAGNMYYAAGGSNWGLAAYQLKELTEMQEVAETTRPARAAELKAFEQGALAPLAKDIVNQDIGAFHKHFDVMVKRCNACHRSSGFGFIVYAIPNRPATPLKLNLDTKFNQADLQKMLAGLLQ
ncbi:MAG: hypothetical protein ABI165_09380 [Bryobacteraceae bacterium]